MVADLGRSIFRLFQVQTSSHWIKIMTVILYKCAWLSMFLSYCTLINTTPPSPKKNSTNFRKLSRLNYPLHGLNIINIFVSSIFVSILLWQLSRELEWLWKLLLRWGCQRRRGYDMDVWRYKISRQVLKHIKKHMKNFFKTRREILYFQGVM